MPATADIRQTPPSPKLKSRRKPHLALKALRINAGLSQEQLGIRVNVSRETIRLVEDYGWVPTPRVQFAIADAFQMRPLDLWPIERQRGVRGSR